MGTTVDCATLRHGEVVTTPLGALRFIRFRYGEATFVKVDTNIREDFKTETGVVDFAAPVVMATVTTDPEPPAEEEHHTK